jgi:hypothetical protein
MKVFYDNELNDINEKDSSNTSIDDEKKDKS